MVLFLIGVLAQQTPSSIRESWPPNATSRYLPEPAARRLLQVGKGRRVFNDYEFSSYLQWRSAGNPPLYIDLLNAYPDKLLKDYFQIVTAEPEGRKMLRDLDINCVFLRRHKKGEGMAKLANYLDKQSQWRRVYKGPDGTIWLKNNTEKMKIPRRDFRNCALLAVLCVLAYLPAIAGLLAGDWPIVDDGITLFNIWHELANRGLKNGVVPLWNPYLFCGLPLFANNQSAILYPPNLLYLIVPMPLALVLDAIFHNVLLAVGAYVLGRAMHLSRTASFAMAVTFSLAGGVAAHIYNGHMTWHAVRAFLPWELAFLLLYLRGGKKQFVVLLGVCFALQVAAGYPPLVLVSAALCIGLVCAWLVAGRRLPQGWLGAAMLFGLLAGTLSSIYILPLAEMSRLSVHGDALDYVHAAGLSGSWKSLVRLFAPGFFGNNTDVQWSFLTPHEEVGYVGLLPLILALAAPLLSHSVKIRRAVWFAWCLLPIAVMMAMGRKLPLYGWVFEVFPPLRQTRVPARWMEIFYYGAALLTGVGFDALIRRRIAGARVERWIGIYFKVLCGVFVLLLAAIALTPPSSSFWIHLAQTALRDSSNFLDDATELWRTAMVESLITVAFAGSLAFLWQRWYSAQETKQIHRLRMMLLILVVLDLTGYFWRSAKVAPQGTMRSHATLPTSLTSRYNAQERWDTKLSYALMNHCAARGIDIFTGYDALGTKRYFQFVEGLEGHSLWGALYEPERRTPLLRVAGVTHSITSPKKTVPKGSKEFPDYKPQLVAADGEFKLWKWEGAWPRAYLTRNVQSSAGEEAIKTAGNVGE